MKIQSQNYITIQGFMRTELGLSGNDLLVYAIIYGFCQDGESGFTLSLQYLADWCGATKQGVQKNLKHLLDSGLIKKDSYIRNGRTWVTYYTTELHTIQLSCMNNISNQLNNNNQLNIIQENNNTNKEDTYNKNKDRVIQFVEDFNRICQSLPKCIRMTAKRSKAISNIIKKYSAEEILTCFEKLEASDFCTGRSGKWRADIDFILREDKFVNVLEGKYDNQGRRCNVETISHGEKKQLTSEEREAIIKNGKKF